MEIKLSVAKIVTGVVTALFVGAAIGSFTLLRTSDNIVFRVGALERESDALESRFVSRTEFTLTIQNQNEKLDRQSEDLNAIKDQLIKLNSGM